MKTLVNRSLSLLLTLALLFTVTPFTALAEAAENEDGMDEIMDIFERYEEETEVSAEPGEALTDSAEETATDAEDQPIEDDSEETEITDEQTEASDQPDTPEEEMIPDDLDDPGVEDDWADWYIDDQPEEESEDTGDDWPETDDALSEEDAGEDAVQPLTLEEEVAQLYDGSYIKYAIEQAGHAYVTTKGTNTKVYETSALEDGEVICAITEKGVILLAFEYAERWNNRSVLVWFLNDACEAVSGYVREADLEQEIMKDADAAAWMNVLPAAYLSTTAGNFPVFVAPIVLPETPEEAVVETPVADTEYPEGSGEEETGEPVVPDEQPEETEAPDIPANQPEEEAEPDDPEVAVGTFLFVTTKTRVFSDMDDTLRDDANGDLYMGVFVKDAVVQVDAVRVDSTGRLWYQVAFIYGDDFADGTMKWTEIGLAYVLPEETALTDAVDLTVTDIALPETPKASGRRTLMKAAGTTPMNGFTLKSINAPIPPLYAGQTGVYGSSGHDSDYKQIASLSGKGAIYATPHYLDGYTVYCLEHNLPGPGEGSGSSQQPKGPYVIVDIDTYMNTPGSSRVIYSDQTMHAIAWVLRHTYPFMVLDRSDSDNETWSRVAGQFAIRQVIMEMEGAQYVRDYWNMDNFYVASGQAPAVYLEYARWLAANGIARGNITGYISVANKTISKVGNNYVGTATLYTDADLIRIPRSGATVTGNTLGSDSSYYYLNSGDTITVTSSTNGFSVTAESVNSDAEEASFLVGVPSISIQKVLIPQYGSPYKMQSTSLYFEQEIQYGSLIVTKLRSGTQQKLAGAKLQLYDSSKNAYGSPVTTDSNGQAQWTNLPYGTYYVGEVGAPAGYRVNVDQVQVTINGNNTATFNNSPIIGSVSFVKVQHGTEIPLAGAQYELVTKSGSNYKRAVSAVDGSELPVLTTDANGKATWSNVVEYGTYYVHEVKAPEGFLLDNTYHAVSVTQHNKIVSADVDDPIITAKIKIAKTDGLTKEPLAGVEFTITRLSGPAAMNGAGVGEVAAVITTDANGYAETDWLDWGRFKVEETKVPAGYTDSHYSTEIEAYKDGKTYTISVENVPAAGYIRLTKTDANSHKPLKGVQFDIYQGDKLISTMTTDASGVALSGALVKGTYTVKEHGNPEGYTGELTTLPATVLSEQTTELSAENTPIQGKIRITKKDALTKEALAGVVFTVTCLSVSSATDGADVGKTFTLTTDQNGVAESGWLNYGRYRIEETSVPEHYVDAHFSAEVEITEHQKTYIVDVENEPTQGKIQITKTDRLDGQPIAGVVFDIYQGSTKVSSMTTNEQGIAVTESLPKGQYTVKEKDNPEGYTGALVSLDCEVQPDGITKLTAENTPIQFRVKIIKKDGLTKQPLAGAVFTITRVSGLPSHNGEGNGAVVATLTTNNKGEATSELLTWGKYGITETVFPAHYVKTPFSITITGTENNRVYEITAENEPTKGKIQITKTDRLDGQPIAGVVFDIYQNETVVGSMTTDDRGVAVSDPLPKGQYTVKERANPEGYVADLVSLNAEVKSDETTKLTADNTPIRFHIKIVKTDGLTKMPLAGAVFTITRISGLPSHNGAGNGEVVAVLTTNEKGEAISDLLTWGVYEVTETTVPEHYMDNGFTITVTGTENNKIYVIACENEPTKGWIRLVKTDSLDDHPIAGVQFDIYQAGEIVSTMTTNADGVAVSEPLHKGKYTVREHENPTGYTAELISLDCEVYSDQTTNLTASNTPLQFRVKIEKTDQLTKEPLAGAEFTITRKSGLPSHEGENDGEVVAVLVTDSNGEAVSDLLTWGVYEVKESKVPVHFVDNHFSTTITGSEDNKTYTIACENEPTKGYIKIVKTDKLDRTPIEGVQFDIYEDDAYGSGLAATMTTDKNGVAVSPALRKGTYIVNEHADPTGYTTDLVELDCVVKSDETTNLSCTNTPIQGKIRIIKTDELTGEALAGAEFTITRVSGLPSHKGSNDGEVVAVIVTDADGIAVSPLLTWGVYHVEETGVPLHYVDNHFSTEVTIDTEDLLTYDVPCENEPTKGWIRLTKTDRKNGNPISGVQFDVFYNDQYGEGLATTMVTDENGVAMSEPIRKGRYIVKEHGETAGYVFEEVTLNCTVKSDEITDLSATNQPVQVRLKLYKRDVDEYAGDPAADPGTRGDGILTGAVFQVLASENITDRQGNILYSKGAIVVESLQTAGEDASVTTEELWPGVYEIAELTPPTGYQPMDRHILVDATSAAQQSQETVIFYDGVVCNEILYGFYAFVKFTGDNEIHDDAGLIEKPEPGAVFQVYLKKAGSYDAARAFERDTITTDENGKTQTKLLPYGIYTVRQTKAKEGYAVKAPFDIFIRGTENPDNPPSMILNNEAIRYRLKFIKVDSETGKTITLANTAFKLKDANGEYVTQTVHYPRTQVIDTFKTDADGTVTLPETVRYGLYFIEEFQAPEGYLLQTEELAVFVGDENMNQPGEAYLLEFKIENTPVKGQIRLEKTGLQLTGIKEKEDRYGNTVMQPIYEEKRLAGAVFEVHAAETITGKDSTVWYEQDALVDTITTTADGLDVSKTLPLGRYYLVEVSAPDGYSFDDCHYEADLIYAGEHTPLVETVITAGNDYLPAEISLTKEKEVLQIVQEGDAIRQIITTVPGEGFTFGLYNDTDIHYDSGTLMADSLIAVGVTDADGKLTFSGNLPHGRYFIKELSAPAGWKINTERFTVTLDPAAADEDHVIRVTLPEAVHDELIWYPVTVTKLDITDEKTLPGALIEVSNDRGEVIYRAYTDKNGQIPNIPVTPGTYTFREILAPSGYALNEAVMSFTVDTDGGITGDTTIRNDYTRVLLQKQDENGLPLAGVEFALTKSNGTVLMRKTSDADGRIVFEKIPYGEYTITETKALAGYQKHDVNIRLTVDGTFVNQTESLETIINHPIIVKLKKVDQDGKPLPGAEYARINEYGEQMMTAVSDADGMLTFYKVPYGKYTVKELYAPDGYLLSKDTPEIVIDDAWQNSDAPVLTLTNHLKRLRYIKVDTNGKYLPGVEFSLINASNGEVVEVVTSNEKGEFIFTKFDYGFWLIRETKVPDGFNQMKDITFSVDASWVEPAPFTCVNIPNHYEFVKTDNEGNPMAGVTFTLEDQDGNILRDLVSGEDGIVHVDGLTPGTYIIREIETLEGYTVSGETIEVVIDEHYIVPDEMYVLVNYPDIQTGVDFEITPWMYAGGAAMLAGLILLLAVLFRRLKK